MSKKKNKNRKKLGKLFYDFLSSVVKDGKKDKFERTLPEVIEESYESKKKPKKAKLVDDKYIYDKDNNIDEKYYNITRKIVDNPTRIALLENDEYNKFIESSICYDLNINAEDIIGIQIFDVYKNIKQGALCMVFTVKYNGKAKDKNVPRSFTASFLMDPENYDNMKIKGNKNSSRQYTLILSLPNESRYNKLTLISTSYFGARSSKKYEYETE